MACDWIEFDKNFNRKPKTLRMMELSGCTVDEATGRMHRFWSWVDDHVGADGKIGLSIETLAKMFGGDLPFWEALKDARIAWLGAHESGELVVPRWKVRFSKSAKQRRDANRRQSRKRSRDEGLGSTKSVTRKRDRRVTKTSTTGQEITGDKSTGQEKEITRASSVSGRIGPQGASLRSAQAPADGQSTSPAAAERGSAVPDASKPVATPVARKEPETTKADERKLIPPEHPFQWDDVRTLANLVAKKAGLTNLTMSDRSLVLKACAISSRLGEHWIHDSLAAVIAAYARKDPPPPSAPRCAYLHGVLGDKCSELGYDFNTLLARVNVPQELLQPPPASASAAAQTAGAT